METNVHYQKEVLFSGRPIGTVFACGSELQVKISGSSMMTLGTGEIHPFTHKCGGFLVKKLDATL